VINSRSTRGGVSIRRRRKCETCQRRFTTHEIVENIPLLVIKKNMSREDYSRDKVISGIKRACQKRPIPFDRIEEIVNNIEKSLYNEASREIPTRQIGEMILKRLRDLDEVAYVRFASVYRDFKDVREFIKEITALQKK